MSHNQEQPFSESHLDSPEYRRRLTRKLNTLIAVLEVACAKVRRSLAGPDADVERLKRIQKNLKDTLTVCVRAKTALERCEKLPDELTTDLSKIQGGGAGFLPDGRARRRTASIEMTSDDEARKFDELGPIDPQDVRSCDLDDLCRQLVDLD